MTRYWAVYDVFLGNPVLVKRCPTRESAMVFIADRGLRNCQALYVVEQLLPGPAEAAEGRGVGTASSALSPAPGLSGASLADNITSPGPQPAPGVCGDPGRSSLPL
jgi:hypothetical protein